MNIFNRSQQEESHYRIWEELAIRQLRDGGAQVEFRLKDNLYNQSITRENLLMKKS